MKNLKRITSAFLIFILSCSQIVFCTESYVWSDTTIETNSEEPSENFLNIQSGSAILIEQNSGKILYDYNSHEQLRPASVTKIMSILLIMEALDSRKNQFRR